MDETNVQESMKSDVEDLEESSVDTSETAPPNTSVQSPPNTSTRHSYANARDVLPAEVLRSVQEHFAGCLWVPRSERDPKFYGHRRRLVLALKAKGVSVDEIARLAGITDRRVYQIVREEIARGALGEVGQETSPAGDMGDFSGEDDEAKCGSRPQLGK